MPEKTKPSDSILKKLLVIGNLCFVVTIGIILIIMYSVNLATTNLLKDKTIIIPIIIAFILLNGITIYYSHILKSTKK